MSEDERKRLEALETTVRDLSYLVEIQRRTIIALERRINEKIPIRWPAARAS